MYALLRAIFINAALCYCFPAKLKPDEGISLRSFNKDIYLAKDTSDVRELNFFLELELSPWKFFIEIMLSKWSFNSFLIYNPVFNHKGIILAGTPYL